MSSEVMMTGDRPLENWPDKEFLEAALRKWLGDPKINIIEFTSRIATNKGENYSSDMYRVTINCEHRKEPLTIIIKRLISTGPTGQIIMDSSSFIREKQMIKTLLPEMHAILKKVISDVEPFGAEYIYSTRGVLVMEDLQQGGFRMAQRRLGLDLNHCSLVIRTLARYHAASVFLMERKSVDVSMLRESILGEECGREYREKFFTGMLTTLSEELKTFEGLEKYSDKLSKFVEDSFLLRLHRLVQDHEDRDFLVLSHGDLWTNNILFRYSTSGEPDGVRFVDLSMPCITSPCIDLQYFLTTSSSETVRTTYFDQLMEEYHRTLCETMATLKCSTKPPNSKNLRKDFDKCTLYGMFAAFVIMPIVLAEPEMFDLGDMVETGKPQNELFRGSSYRKVLEWFLPKFESKGFL